MAGSVYSDRYIIEVIVSGVEKAASDLRRLQTLTEQSTQVHPARLPETYTAPQQLRSVEAMRAQATEQYLLQQQIVNDAVRRRVVSEGFTQATNKAENVYTELARVEQIYNRYGQIVNEIKRTPINLGLDAVGAPRMGWRIEQTFDPQKAVGKVSDWQMVRREVLDANRTVEEFIRTQERFTRAGESVMDVVGRMTRTNVYNAAGQLVGGSVVERTATRDLAGGLQWTTMRTPVAPTTGPVDLGWINTLTQQTSRGIPVMREYQRVIQEFDSETGQAINRITARRREVYDPRTGQLIGQTISELTRGEDGIERWTQTIDENLQKSENRVKGYAQRFAHHMRIIVEAMLAYEGLRALGRLAESWVEAHAQMDWALAQFRINLSVTQEEITRYQQQVAELSFATGTPIPETLETASLAARLRRPELAEPATQIEMIWGVQSTQAIRDLFAIQQQFPSTSLEEIMNVLMRSVRAGSLSGAEVLSLSETWGAFSRQFVADLDEISALFVALGTVLGESGGSLETFMRHLQQFYTNPTLAQLTEQYTGVPTVEYTPEGEEIRRPMLEILNDISQLSAAQIQSIAEFMPQELGQKSQQFFNTMISQWDVMMEVMDRSTNSVYEFRTAVEEVAETLQVAQRRVKTEWQAFLASLGETVGITNILNTLAANLNVRAQRNIAREAGWTNAYSSLFTITPPVDTFMRFIMGLRRQMDLPVLNEQQELILHRELINLPVMMPPRMKGADFTTRLSYIDAVTSQFFTSREFDPSQTGEEIARAFHAFVIAHGEEIARSILETGRRPELPEAYGNQILRNLGLTGALVEALPWQYPKDSFWYDWRRRETGEAENILGSPSARFSYGVTPSIRAPEGVTAEQLQAAIDKSQKDIEQSIIEYNKIAKELGTGLIALNRGAITTSIVLDSFGRVLGTVTGTAYATEGALDALAQSSANAASALLDLGTITLPENVSLDQWLAAYDALQRQLSSLAEREGRPLGEKAEPGLILGPGGQIVGIENFDPRVANILNQQFSFAQTAHRESMGKYDQMIDSQRGLIRDIINAIPGVRSGTSVTGIDLFLNTPGGAYREKFDEAVRRATADVNNLMAGRPLEYGLGTAIAPDIFTPEVMAAARTLPLDQASQVLQEALAEFKRQFYGGIRPMEEYNAPAQREVFIAEARRVIDEKQRAKKNQAMYERWMEEAGLGMYSAEVLSLMDQPPIVRALTGGKSEQQIQTMLADIVDVPSAIAESVSEGQDKAASAMQQVSAVFAGSFRESIEGIAWTVIISQAIIMQIKKDTSPIENAGKLMGEAMAKGAADRVAETIIAKIIKAIGDMD